MSRLLTVLAVLLALTFAACGSDDDDSGDSAATQAETTAETTAAAPAAGECTPAEPAEPKDSAVGEPTGKLDPAKTYVATVTTNCGTFEITLDVKRAPKTSNSFKHLADEGFYDGTSFHRIVPGFVIQGGDPAGDGTGGPDYSVEEAPPSDIQYTKGVVAMAKTGAEPAGTSGSQFYVVSGDDAGLPADYALLGEVTEGIDVVTTIEGVETDPSTEQPVSPVIIESIKVAES
ncbi:MAG: peptidylprolyl isomerase [Solirubrobacteraceae bacterium]|nr:peptidylprolyl isomerase [Solirubrobacteraceae bacterium]